MRNKQEHGGGTVYVDDLRRCGRTFKDGDPISKKFHMSKAKSRCPVFWSSTLSFSLLEPKRILGKKPSLFFRDLF